jgi:hypothetical protein
MAVVPFHGWLKHLTRAERKQKSLTVLNITTKENSVGGHAHPSPVFFSQSPVDAQMRKGERKFNVRILPQCGK